MNAFCGDCFLRCLYLIGRIAAYGQRLVYKTTLLRNSVSRSSKTAASTGDTESQRHVSDPSAAKNEKQADIVDAGRKAEESPNQGLDPASSNLKEVPEERRSGKQPENVGLMQEITGQSVSAQHYEKQEGKQGES